MLALVDLWGALLVPFLFGDAAAVHVTASETLAEWRADSERYACREEKLELYFVDRTDVTFAVDDGVDLQDLVTTIDIANGAGFADVRLTTIADLRERARLREP